MESKPPEGRQTWLQYGSRLVRVRGEQSQAAFAPKIGIHKNTLGHYERGTRELGADALRSLVYAGWNANWLLTGEGPERLIDTPDLAAETALQSHSQPVRLHVETLREATRSLIRVCAAYGFAYDPVEDVDLLAEFYAEGMEEDGEISAENVIRLVERIAERRREQEKQRGGTNGEEAERVGRRAAGKGARQG